MPTDQTSTIEELRALCQRFRDDRDWKGDNAATFAKAIAVEAAELLDHFVWDDDAYLENPELAERIKYELVDVLYCVLVMSKILNVDLSSTLHKKIKLLEQKYPAEACRQKMNEPVGARIKWYAKLKREFKQKNDV